MKHRIKVTQFYRVTQETTIDVEADDLENAVEQVKSGDFDGLPEADGPKWKRSWDLEDEEVEGIQ